MIEWWNKMQTARRDKILEDLQKKLQEKIDENLLMKKDMQELFAECDKLIALQKTLGEAITTLREQNEELHYALSILSSKHGLQ